MPKIPDKLKSRSITPYWATSDGETVKLYQGNAVDVLSNLPAQSVHMVVTSPPYWGLRDYGTGKWEGGTPDCDHSSGRTGRNDVARKYPGSVGKGLEQIKGDRKTCFKCGARRIDMQLGSEPSPDCGTHGQAQCGQCFVCSMVAVFRGVHRVLRDDGTIWLNLGDTYGGGGTGGASAKQDSNKGSRHNNQAHRSARLRPGNLVGVPWRVALALQTDGWILRQDIIWHKKSPMPESVRNRCTKAHEYVFLFAKKSGYFYDAEAVKESAGNSRTGGAMNYRGDNGREYLSQNVEDRYGSRNKRSVWSVASFGYPGAHFATFPPKLIEPCILAGTSEYGCCVECGAPWKRVLEEKELTRERPNDYVKRTGEEGTGNSCSNSVAGVDTKTIGWESSCDCGTDGVESCTILYPFIGSGTTCCVALDHGRRSIGIDLSAKYLEKNAVPRIKGVLLGRPALAHLAGEKTKKVRAGKSVIKKK